MVRKRIMAMPITVPPMESPKKPTFAWGLGMGQFLRERRAKIIPSAPKQKEKPQQINTTDKMPITNEATAILFTERKGGRVGVWFQPLYCPFW